MSRTRTAASAVLVVATGVAVVAAAVGFGGAEPAAPATTSLPPATAEVTRGTLQQTDTVSGTLGYGDATVVSGRGGGGTVTWLAPVGSTVRRGQPLFKVDERPVVLIYGSTPAYRRLEPGLTGRDVAQLERSLSALGYDGFTVDDEYTSLTADAVRDWQDDLGVDETGTVDPGAVVVAPRAVRVSEWKVGPGDPATGPVLAYTGTTRVVDVPLDVAKQHLVRKGIAATVTLPDGKTVKGTVSGVGTVATASTTGQEAQAETTTTIDVVVTVADQKALGTLDAAPVDVTLVSEQRRNVLTVPVGALLALAEGGYGVQLVEGSSARYVAVEAGLFAGGRVEISGEGITEGAVVGVPT